MKRPPRFVWIVTAVVVIGLVVAGSAAWVAHQINESEGHRDCERAVAARDDSRAMWLYALGTADDPNDPKVRAFTKKLDELLPPLTCDGSTWVPVDR